MDIKSIRKKVKDVKCTCIIPFYNENPQRVVGVIKTILKVKNISEVICIDDGSDLPSVRDEIIKGKLAVNLIILKKNTGKAEAVKTALESVKTDYIILIDADLINIDSKEIENTIALILTNPKMDMIIFKRIKELFYIKLLRWDILISGERVLKTNDLRQILRDKPHGYLLEYAINRYMMREKKKVFWVPSAGENIYKIYKYGFAKGFLHDVKIHIAIMRYAGIVFLVRCFMFFCRENAVDYAKKS